MVGDMRTNNAFKVLHEVWAVSEKRLAHNSDFPFPVSGITICSTTSPLDGMRLLENVQIH
jgi:hypothetical protein